MKKRIISLLLAVVMIVGMLPLSAIPAFAETVGEIHTLTSGNPHAIAQFVDKDYHKFPDCDALEEHCDGNDDGFCDFCAFDLASDIFGVEYIEKSVTENNTVITNQVTCPYARSIDANADSLGKNGKTVWYIVDGELTLKNRPMVNGDVRIIIADNAKLIVNQGIELESSNSLALYLQLRPNPNKAARIRKAKKSVPARALNC